MKFLLLALLSLSVISCASRTPSSSTDVENQEVERGINAEYYGSPSLN